VGDKIYDVIILEYFSDIGNILQLSRRLRQRFPKATIIFLRVWNPSQLSYRPASNKNLRYWVKATNFTSIHDPDLHRFLLEETSADDWAFHSFADCAKKQDEAIREVGGVLVEMQRPSDLREALAQNAHLYSEDMVHWSNAGHNHVANMIRRVLEEKGVRRQDVVNPWESKDYCQSWFETGERRVAHSPNMKLRRLTEDKNLHKHQRDFGKYALEVPYGEQSWIKVDNPTAKPSQMYVRYMAMGPGTTKYPTTQLYMNHSLTMKTGIVVNPIIVSYDRYVHLNQVRSLGSIPPGENALIIEPKEANKDCSFRVTGVIVSCTEQEDDLGSSLFSEKASNHHWV